MRRPNGLAVPATLAVTAVAAVAGVVLLAAMLGQPRLRTGEMGRATRAGGLAVSVLDAAWVDHDMSGMSMPMATMADMPPEGYGSLRVEVLVDNPAAGTRIRGGQFAVVTDGGESYSADHTTLPTAGLDAKRSVVSDLYFEIPERAAGLHLTMNRGSDRLIVPLSTLGAMPAHPDPEETSAGPPPAKSQHQRTPER